MGLFDVVVFLFLLLISNLNRQNTFTLKDYINGEYFLCRSKLYKIDKNLHLTSVDNPDLYQQNPMRFDEASQLLEAKQQEKASKEEAWLEIEILAEEINS